MLERNEEKTRFDEQKQKQMQEKEDFLRSFPSPASKGEREKERIESAQRVGAPAAQKVGQLPAPLKPHGQATEGGDFSVFPGGVLPFPSPMRLGFSECRG